MWDVAYPYGLKSLPASSSTGSYEDAVVGGCMRGSVRLCAAAGVVNNNATNSGLFGCQPPPPTTTTTTLITELRPSYTRRRARVVDCVPQCAVSCNLPEFYRQQKKRCQFGRKTKKQHVSLKKLQPPALQSATRVKKNKSKHVDRRQIVVVLAIESLTHR